MEINYDYDLFVIGGGSGGLSASKAAAINGLKVGLADFVKPSTQGTKWGLGGTCVNVGCIPKKLMHYASLVGELRSDQYDLGLSPSAEGSHNWEAMLEKINNYIRGLNWGYRVELSSKEVTYFEALGRVVAPNTIELTFAKKPPQRVTAKFILLATGGRPSMLELPGAVEHCLTSDDIFWRNKPPGKCLVVGAGYIGLECGGFLGGMGYPVTILHRSVMLRGFDSEMVDNVVDYMKQFAGVKFVQGNPIKFEKQEGQVLATWSNDKKETHSELFDTVLMATGRSPDIKGLGLNAFDLKLDKSGKIVVNNHFETSVPGIYAIGDIIADGRELTPVAIQQGKKLAKGLFQNDWTSIDLKSIATTVFSPLEYASSGHSEEEAIADFGKEGIQVFTSEFTPAEWLLGKHKSHFKCLMKVIVRKSDEVVVGIHYNGPNAGELVQGLSMAVRLKVSYSDFQKSISPGNSLGDVMVSLKLRNK